MTLPFVSYGGTSTIAIAFAHGADAGSDAHASRGADGDGHSGLSRTRRDRPGRMSVFVLDGGRDGRAPLPAMALAQELRAEGMSSI